MRITLNGHVYELVPGTGVHREPIVEFPGPTRDQGQQERQQRVLMSAWEFSDFTYGSGIERMDIDQERDKASYWRSTLDTRWRGKVMLPPLVYTTGFATASCPSPAGAISWNQMVSNDAAWLLTKVPSAADRNEWAVFQYSKTGSMHFQHLSAVASGFGPSHGIIGLKRLEYETATNKYWYYCVGTAMAGIYFQDLPASNLLSGGTPTMQAKTRGTGHATMSDCNVSDFYGHVGTMHIGTVDRKKRNAFVHPVFTGTYEESTDAFKHETYNPPWLAHTPDGLFAGASKGVDVLNMVRREYTSKLDLSGYESQFNCQGMAPWGNEYLMVPYRDPRGLGGMIAFNTVNQISVRVGVDLDDGVPSGWSSEVQALKVTPDFVFAAFSRPLASYPNYRAGFPRVQAYDGYGWHFMAECPTASPLYEVAQMRVIDEPDGIPKLFMVPTGAQATPYMIQYPMSNPLEQGGYEFATQGKLRLPIFNGGMPEHPAGFYAFVIEGSGLSTMCTIDAFYGLDGAEPTMLLGTATQNGVRTFKFGDGLGVEGHEVQMELVLTRGTVNTETPVLIAHHSPVLHYIKYPSKREVFKFNVDLAKTIHGTKKSPKDAYDNLMAVATSHVLLPFHYSHIPTKNVKMVSLISDRLSDDYVYTGDAVGPVEVTLAELL